MTSRGDARWLIVLFVIVWVVSIAFYIHAQITVHHNCQDGVVLKNTFDWPVCVKSGS